MYHVFTREELELCHVAARRCECGTERVLNAHTLGGEWRWDWICTHCDSGLEHAPAAVVDATRSALERALREHRVVI